MKLCDHCGVNEANIHLTQIVKGKTSSMHLCNECAGKKGISITLGSGQELTSVQGVGAGKDPDGKQGREERKRQDRACSRCGLLLSEFRTRGWLGCPGCYDAFRGEIDELLVRVHGSTVHKGKHARTQGVPGHGESDRLRAELEQAVRDEDFEQAAVIRDILRGSRSVKGEAR